MKLRKTFLAGASAGIMGLVAPAQAITAYCIQNTDGGERNLVRFDTEAPGVLLSSVPISGLGAFPIEGLDYRPADGKLYAITEGGTRTYSISYASGVATFIGSQNDVSPIGLIGYDFNPVVDRIRVVDSFSDTNYRINPNNGALAGNDTPLAYAPGDPNAGQDPAVRAVAYTNNVPAAASTTLFGIDSGLDVLVRIGGPDGVPSPNSGILTTIGPLGVAITDNFTASLDVAPGGDISTAFAALIPDGTVGSALYSIDLATGAATLIGQIGGPGFFTGSITLIPDEDSDGVPDGLDQCFNTLPGVQVGDTGCPLVNPITGPDLTGLWAAGSELCGNDPTKLKCKIKGKIVIVNVGQADAGQTTVRFYLSDNAAFDANDTFLASKNINLKAGKVKVVKFNVKTGTPQLPGRFLIALIDGDSLVVETDESNNILVRGPN